MPARPLARRGGISLEIRSGIATIELPGGLLDEDGARDLCDACERIEFDDEVRVVVLRSRAGDFHRGATASAASRGRYDCFAAVTRLSAPVIAEVRGAALAEGCELALAADLRFAASGARFQWTSGGGDGAGAAAALHRLAQIVGRTRALELLGGRTVWAREALRIGLATRVVPADRLCATVRRAAAALATRGPIALRYAKEAVWKGLDMTFEQGMRLEQDLYVLLQTTEDRREGVRSFLEKRPPRFRGR